jgi:hypothetical protein
MMSAWDLHKAWPEADFRVRRVLLLVIDLAYIHNILLHAMIIIYDG